MMRRDKEWLKEEIGELPCVDAVFNSDGSSYIDSVVPVMAVYDLIDQLDEPETLSQEENIYIVLDDLKEHIKEQQSLSQNVGMAHTPAGNDTHYRQYDFVLECINEYEPTDDLQNLLVPKKKENPKEYFEVEVGGEPYYVHEEAFNKIYDNGYMQAEADGERKSRPTIPQFVAEWIDKYQKHEDIYTALSDGFEGMESAEVYNWLHGYKGVGNQELFARAWLDGYEVEEEQKYYVKDEKGNTLLRKVIKGFGIDDRKGKIVSSTKVGEASDARLTEKEIKDYDERYWAFAKPERSWKDE